MACGILNATILSQVNVFFKPVIDIEIYASNDYNVALLEA